MRTNPFNIGGKIETRYFCDRETESEKLFSLIIEGKNIIISAPRGMGKTSLIRRVFEYPALRQSHFLIRLNMLSATTPRELAFLTIKSVFTSLWTKDPSQAADFLHSLETVNGISDALPVSPQTSDVVIPATVFPLFHLSDIPEPELTLEEIFIYLDRMPFRCVIAINEFQQADEFDDKNFSRQFKRIVKSSSNCSFIFAGCNFGKMSSFLLDRKNPLCLKEDVIMLDPIAKEVYSGYTEKLFNIHGKRVNRSDIESFYDLLDGTTFFLQKLMNMAFSITEQGDICNKEIMETALREILDVSERSYREIMSNVPERQKEVLMAIAREGKVEKIMAVSFMKKHALSSPSSIQAALRVLLAKGLVTFSDGSYSLNDKFFSLWLSRQSAFSR